MNGDIRENTFGGNLFVITTVGQLRNIYGFIEQYKATDNTLIVLYTVANMAIVDNIKENILEGVFEDVYYLEHPLQPLKWTRAKGKEIFRAYDAQITRLISEYGIKNVILCNRDNYYIFFEKLKKKHDYSLYMLEEGLTTYRLFREEYLAKHYERNLEWLLKDAKGIYRAIKAIIRSVLLIFVDFASFIIGKDVRDIIKQARSKVFKYRYGRIKNFDGYHVCYPELVKEYRPDIDNIQTLDFDSQQSDVVFVENAEQQNVLFLNQPYDVDYDTHFKIILALMAKHGVEEFYIKLHPREDARYVYSIIEGQLREHPNMKVHIAEGVEGVPAEKLLLPNNIGTIYALSSSTLMYAKLINSDIRTYALGGEFVEACNELYLPRKAVRRVEKDYLNIACFLEKM